MKFYLVSSALVLFITAPGISAADKQRRRLRGSHVTDYSNYDEAIANAEDDEGEGRDQYQYQHAYTGGRYQDGYNYYHDNPGYQQYTNGPEDDEGRTSYSYNNYYNNPGPGREVARESGYTFGHDGFPEAASFAALAGEWTCDTRVCCGDETWAKCGLLGGASCNVSCNGYNNDGSAPLFGSAEELAAVSYGYGRDYHHRRWHGHDGRRRWQRRYRPDSYDDDTVSDDSGTGSSNCCSVSNSASCPDSYEDTGTIHGDNLCCLIDGPTIIGGDVPVCPAPTNIDEEAAKAYKKKVCAVVKNSVSKNVGCVRIGNNKSTCETCGCEYNAVDSVCVAPKPQCCTMAPVWGARCPASYPQNNGSVDGSGVCCIEGGTLTIGGDGPNDFNACPATAFAEA